MKIDDMVTVEVTPIEKETIIFTEKTRDWCKIPYPGHPKGCDDNYNKCETCPPKTPYRDDIIDKYDTFVLVHATFDIQEYVEGMREIHPDYSDKQLRNLLWWQGQLRRILREKIVEEGLEWDELFGAGKKFKGCPSMEASGIHVFATFQRNGIKFDKKARKFVKMACLLVSKKKEHQRPSLSGSKKSSLMDFLTIPILFL